MENTRTLRQFKAFSLIEVIFYVAIISIFSVVIASFWGSITEIQERNQAMSAINTEAAYILNTLSRSIRNATSITSPTAGNSASTLSLTGTPTTVFTAATGGLTMQEGAGAAVSLKSNQVTITSLTFTNVSNTGTAGAIRIALTLNYVNSSGKVANNYTQTYYDTVTIRK